MAVPKMSDVVAASRSAQEPNMGLGRHNRHNNPGVFPRRLRFIAWLALGAWLSFVGAGLAAADEPRLYPTGPPNGVAYLRFVNLSSQTATIVSPNARLTVAADAAHRIRQYDPVVPNVALTGTVQVGEASKPIDVKLAPNELGSVVITMAGDGDLKVTVFRDTPDDFNALKSALVLLNADDGCAGADLVAGDKHTPVISTVAPGSLGRRMVNPVDVALAVMCGGAPGEMPVALGPLVAGERYSIFVFGAPGSDRQVVGLRDEMALLAVH